MDKRLHISAKNTTDLLPNERVLHAASAGGVDSPSQGARITVGIVNRIAPQNAMCKRWDTLVCVVFCCPFACRVSCCDSVSGALPGSDPSGRESAPLAPAPSII